MSIGGPFKPGAGFAKVEGGLRENKAGDASRVAAKDATLAQKLPQLADKARTDSFESAKGLAFDKLLGADAVLGKHLPGGATPPDPIAEAPVLRLGSLVGAGGPESPVRLEGLGEAAGHPGGVQAKMGDGSVRGGDLGKFWAGTALGDGSVRPGEAKGVEAAGVKHLDSERLGKLTAGFHEAQLGEAKGAQLGGPVAGQVGDELHQELDGKLPLPAFDPDAAKG